MHLDLAISFSNDLRFFEENSFQNRLLFNFNNVNIACLKTPFK